jgi:cytochrome c oxidase subunit 4
MEHHLVSRQSYYRVFAALLLLTATTVGVAFVDLGRLNAILALVIAAGKASLVILFFMHVRYLNRFIAVCMATGLFWLLLLLALTMSDYLTRGRLPVTGR